MRTLFAGISALLLSCGLGTSHAQTAAPAANPAGPLHYDLVHEAALSGTVAEVLAKPSPGMLAGSHLLLTTLTGPVDVSLGAFGLRGREALSVSGGQQVEVIGVMKTFKGKQVFWARTVKVADRTYAIRNEHGIPVTPQSRERASQNGETR